MVQHYEEIASKYDDIYLTLGYHDHEKCNEMASQLFPDVEARANLQVFDMGCGTGLVGEEMQKNGFSNIVGCDASKAMCDQAATKNDGKAYTELLELYLGRPDTFPENLKNRFDIVTGAGILAQGHLDKKVFDEMLAATKGPGSYVIITTRESYMTQYGYQEKVDDFIQKGIWKEAGCIKFHRYDNLGDSQVGRYKKAEILCLAYQILQK